MKLKKLISVVQSNQKLSNTLQMGNIKLKKLIGIAFEAGLIAANAYQGLSAPTKKKIHIGAAVILGLVAIRSLTSTNQAPRVAFNYNSNIDYTSGSYLYSPTPITTTNNVSNRQLLIVVGGDGSFLGIVNNNRYDNKSICNPYGTYGSKYDNKSIFNSYGTHGGQYSDLGAYNPRAQKPPMLKDSQGQILQFISKNDRFGNRIDPDIFHIQICGEPL
jgi:hypothetical protein